MTWFFTIRQSTQARINFSSFEHKLYLKANFPYYCSTLQLKVVAYDNQKPLLRTTADVTINVQRNLNGPQFFPKTETIDLPVDTNPDFWSMTQNVSDPDSVCILICCTVFVIDMLLWLFECEKFVSCLLPTASSKNNYLLKRY